MSMEGWNLVIGIAAICSPVLLLVATVVMSIIGYFLNDWMKETKADLACLPAIQTQLAVINVDNKHLRDAQHELKRRVDRLSQGGRRREHDSE